MSSSNTTIGSSSTSTKWGEGMTNPNSNNGTVKPSTTNTTNTTNYNWIKGYDGAIGCYNSRLVNAEEMIKAAENESFSEDRMNVVQQASKGKCFTVDQVSQISSVFTFEEDKLDFVKWAYDSTYDIDNFYKLNAVFTFSDSKNELNEFLKTK
jgi:hypothetical protein